MRTPALSRSCRTPHHALILAGDAEQDTHSLARVQAFKTWLTALVGARTRPACSPCRTSPFLQCRKGEVAVPMEQYVKCFMHGASFSYVLLSSSTWTRHTRP